MGDIFFMKQKIRGVGRKKGGVSRIIMNCMSIKTKRGQHISDDIKVLDFIPDHIIQELSINNLLT